MELRLRRVPGVVLVSVAAALWGTDALFRRPLAQSTSAATIVFGEHVFLVLVTLPFLLSALVAVRRGGLRYLAAAIGIGAGASAIATILFTNAFVHGDPITPVVLQKVQPLVAVAGARVLLGERPRPNFIWFLLAGLVGIWLIAFPQPTAVSAHGLLPVGEALAAAVLWALGTVLGRYLSRALSFTHVVTLRFAFGLPASAVALLVLGAPATASWHDTLWIVVLAFVTGAVALALYYIGLQRTPATIASLAELAYPVTAGVVGYAAFGASLRWSQWLGVLVTVCVVAALPARRREMVRVPAPAPASA